MDNKLLRFVYVFLRIIQIGYAAMILLNIYLFVASVFGWTLPAPLSAEGGQWHSIEFTNDGKVFANAFNTGFYAGRTILLFSLFILTLESIRRLIHSISSLSAFKSSSIDHLKRITRYMIVAFLVTMVGLNYLNDAYTIKFSFEFQYLLFAFISLVLSQVFREGNRLWEESKFTV